MDSDNYLKVLLAITIWREARGESDEGMRAVAHVVRNRHSAWNMDWDQVIAARNQFSSMTFKGDQQLVMWPDDDSDKFKHILNIAEAVFDGKDVDLTNGALYYWNPKTANSPWFVANVASKMLKSAVIGAHEFFRP